MSLDQAQKDTIRHALEESGVSLQHLILGADGRTPVLTDIVGYLEWAEGHEMDRLSVQVAFDQVGDVEVSTVFIPVAVFPGSRYISPQPFETMVFGKEGQADVAGKYSNWADAESGHQRAR